MFGTKVTARITIALALLLVTLCSNGLAQLREGRKKEVPRPVGASELRKEIAGYLPSIRQGRGRQLSAKQKSDIAAIAAKVNAYAKSRMRAQADLIAAVELEKAVVSRNGSSFAFSAAQGFQKWYAAQPPYRTKVWERYALIAPQGGPLSDAQLAQVQQALSGQEQQQAQNEEGSSGWVAVIVGIAEAADALIDVVNDVLGEIGDGDDDTGETPPGQLPGGVSLQRQTHLSVPWRGYEWGNNNQSFTARYTVTVVGGTVDELKVRFRMDLSGSGFDRLNYPITHNGDSITAIRTTRYQQIHEVVKRNASSLQIGVEGKVEYGGDGFMTDAGLVPTGTATKNGVTVEFGEGDSIWKYGTSI